MWVPQATLKPDIDFLEARSTHINSHDLIKLKLQKMDVESLNEGTEMHFV